VMRAARQTIAVLCLSFLWITPAFASPAPQQFFSCTDYHCDTGKMVTLSASQWRAVRNLFTAGASPAEERAAIRKAIALLEHTVGALTGTWRDLGGNVAGAGEAGQLDCISESKNTTTYLQLLADDGLLKWHDIGERRIRHTLIFNAHWTAVIIERNSGKHFAVDSWFLDNGEPPRIQPLSDWLQGRDIEND